MNDNNIVSDNEFENNEWGFDDDDIILEDDDDDESPLNHLSSQEKMLRNLRQYYAFLSRNVHQTMSNINTYSFSKQKTISAGRDLQEYYLQRPQLFSYTFNTELHRMEYTIRDTNGSVYKNPDEIRRRYDQREDIALFRAANQSLLADAIQCLSNSSSNDSDNQSLAIIRSEYLATAVANKCHFEVDLVQQAIICDCSLILSVPLGNARLELASLKLEIYFSLNDAELQMKIVNLAPKQIHQDKLEQVATLLVEQQEMMNEFESENDLLQNSKVAARDSYVKMIPNQEGMSSALKQMDSVVNVSEKLSFFSKINSFLPSADLLAAVEQQEEEEAEEYHHLKSIQKINYNNEDPNQFKLYRNIPQPNKTSTSEISRRTTVPTSNLTLATNDFSNSYNEIEEEKEIQILDSERPKPILGGMVRNLTNKLSSAPAQENPLRLYNKDLPPPSQNKPIETPIRLYNTKSPTSSENPLRLYNMEQETTPRSKPPPPPPPVNRSALTISYESSYQKVSPPLPPKPPSSSTKIPKSTQVVEGWSSDEDNLNFDDENEDNENQDSTMSKIFLKDLVLKSKSHASNSSSHRMVTNEFDIIPTRKRWLRSGINNVLIPLV